VLELALVAALLAGQTDDDGVPEPAVVDPDPTAPPGGAYDYALANTHLVDVGGGATKVTAISQFPTPGYGYFPLVVHIDNTLGPRQTVGLSYTTSGTGGSHQYSRSVEVAQGERRAVSIPVPAHLRYGNLKVRAPGITERGEAHVNFSPVTVRQRAVMNIGTAESFQAAVGAKPSFSGSANVQVVTFSANEAPGELAPYLGWDAVVVSGVKLEQLSEAQRRALEEYAALGGHLVVTQSVRGLSAAFPLLAADSDHYGIGRVTFCERCGAGEVLDYSARVPVRAIEPKGRRSRYTYEEDPTTELQLPMAVAPIGRFLIIITLFTLAIGPGSLWVARRKGPAALLVTIPGTAAVTCVLIVGYSALRDGFTVHSTVQGFTLLDSVGHRAVTASVGAFYANLAPGSARFSPTELVVAPTTAREYGGVEQGASINWDEGLKLGADFVPSRSYVEWSFASVAPTRARLVVKHSGATVRVQNALGSQLEYALLRLPDGAYTVASVRDGEETVATLQNGAPLPQLGALDKRISDDARVALTAKLREGEFVALLSGPGFTPLGGLSLEHSQSRHLVRGGYER
jgi:hypothetical protein